MFCFDLCSVDSQLWVLMMSLFSEDGEYHPTSFCVFPYYYCAWDSFVPIEALYCERKHRQNWQGINLSQTRQVRAKREVRVNLDPRPALTI